MPTQDKENRPNRTSWKELASGTSMFVLMIVLVISLGLYFRNSIESLEEKLSFQPVGGGQTIGKDTYGVDIVDGQTVYVPVYSHIYADGGKPHLLETTLSIRNLDLKRAITIKSVKYFDTKGALVKEYLDGDISLGALATTEFLVEKRDTRGGSGANFVVVWDANKSVHEPLIEAVMVGFADANSISFTSPGRTLIERKKGPDPKP